MMPPTQKSHPSLSVSLDKLSNLPEDVTNVILMRLPWRDAVRTSILSNEWRYKWCSLPELTLDLIHLPTKEFLTPAFQSNIIYHLLTLHNGPITKFALCFRQDCPAIDNLICFLSRHGSQHLVLDYLGEFPYKLPSSVFSWLHLRHLTLKQCEICLPPLSFKGFDRLISLELYYVTISSTFLESLISLCPLLKQLVLLLYLSDVVEINAPMLRYFDFRGKLRFIYLKNVPLLENLLLECFGNVRMGGKSDIVKFFKSFSALKCLHLDNNSLRFFARGGGAIPTRLPFDLSSVEHFYLSHLYLDERNSLLCALCLIRSFPYLKYMEIQVSYDQEDIPALECLELEASSDVAFNHLREFKLEIHVVTKPVMQLTKLLLAKSPVLLRMQVEVVLDSDALEKAFKTSALVNSFRRASPEAEVIYNVKNFLGYSIFD